ncbi:hypothetical protein HBH69_042160 [Parastagonospora nodorum]|nr:hypothetical protein HBH69_042160 [Parastagonospora nodorum]KAH6122551.1 hypothetical protein HBI69_057110 [Parastagonospora nodorum]KAH6308477.1 hypothetical protein HBI39_091270 [Parastagonospora nodorum]KAH6351562.1 hypothetical protein HBI37_036500 [Parastagonospora nodorum]KAH6356147.1 hypothetical protein HBI36_081710 [Parastagonospora nodorum]
MPDWTFVSKFGAEVAKRAGVSKDQVWESMIGGGLLTVTDGEHAYTFTEEDKAGFGEKLWQWIQKNSGEVTKLTACIAAGPAAVFAAPAAVGLLGFGPLGPIAGARAAAAQAAMGPVAAGSAFAVLQSAGMGGMGLIVVKAIAAGGAVVPTCSFAAVSFLNAMKEDNCGSGERNDEKKEREKEKGEKKDQ